MHSIRMIDVKFLCLGSVLFKAVFQVFTCTAALTFLLPRPRAASAFLPCLISYLLKITLFLSSSMAASSDNSNVCSTLASQLPGQISYAQDADYAASIKSYFYQQARLGPQCIVYPKRASDVSRIVKTLVARRAKAAVRGGGHTPIANAANIENAVTIDLSNMNAVSLVALGLSSFQNDTDSSGGPLSSSAASSHLFEPNDSAPSVSDQSFSILSSHTTSEKAPLDSPNTLSAGGGATWGDVYKKLDSTGLISIGGRGTSLGYCDPIPT